MILDKNANKHKGQFDKMTKSEDIVKIIQRVQRLEDEWEDENTPEYFWVILEENESVEDGSWYETEKQARREYEKLPEDERY